MSTAELRRRTEADDLVRRAHAGVHRWPPGHPGFVARLSLFGPEGIATGDATVRPGELPELAIEAGDADRAWASEQIAQMVDHRAHRAYEDADGRFGKDLAEPGEGPLGRKIVLHDPMLSSYWIRDGRIERIVRSTPAGARFAIVIQDVVEAPDGTTASTDFTVVHEDGDPARIVRVDVYCDRYAVEDGVLLPALRRIVTSTTTGWETRELRLSGHRGLAEAPR